MKAGHGPKRFREGVYQRSHSPSGQRGGEKDVRRRIEAT